ncbi:hypothetical protein SEA_SUCCESS_28 [Streptomyces phage Success]|uniref:Uncharacterized protein n=1 Tax=Streptomyces phage Success TaxID=2999013 RepID=A0A9E8M5W7_9CAUD|nr:hypothetical protein QEH47_gp28 [Streptomyces phage Success]WAB08815.1 hypothetical protein SEA_SUCCESS_28 [Streptomyces phage Success]
MNVGSKVLITEGPHSGKRGRVASVRNRTHLNPYTLYVKVYGPVIRYLWFMEDEVRADLVKSDPIGKADSVNHPSHYTWLPNGLEVIDLTEHMNFNRGNAVKYIARAGRKSKATELEDLKKARWYIEREIFRMEAS